MDTKKTKKLLAYLAAIYWVLVITIYLVAGDQFHYTTVTSDSLSASTTIGEVVDGITLRQTVVAPADEVREIAVMTATYGRTNQGTMVLTLCDAQGNLLSRKAADVSSFSENKYTSIILDQPVTGHKGETLHLIIETQGCAPGNSVSLYAGNTVTTGRFDIVQSIGKSDLYQINGELGTGKLCVKLTGMNQLHFYKTYWLITGGLFAAVAAMCARWWMLAGKGRNNPLVSVYTLYTRYQFLIKQLVSRDFKTKYKRSALGMAWSFLNPLLTMSVQYVVFSTLFKSDIPNYSVYLLTGIVFMNFFNEAVSMGMTSITSNASLIKKVYMPKYIYPITRMISSLVNFMIALLPLLLVMLLNQIWPRPALLLLVFDIMCMLGFVVGMGLLLTTAMTFFQDTQFLWSIASMMWMYMTPVFYPETIIPAKFLTLYHMNPMYQYITFARICIIDGVSPEPMAYLWCIVSSLGVLALGAWVFKKKQDQFVLYL